MHWMDYQKKLGLGFDDNRKGLRFVAQMHNYFANSTDIEFSRGVEITFCNIIGMPTKPEEDPYRLFGDELYGLQRAWLYLEERQAYFSDFLSCCVALINSYPKKEKAVKNALKRELFDALSNSQIKYNILMICKRFSKTGLKYYNNRRKQYKTRQFRTMTVQMPDMAF